MAQNKLPYIVNPILLSTKFEAERKKLNLLANQKEIEKKRRKFGIGFSFD